MDLDPHSTEALDGQDQKRIANILSITREALQKVGTIATQLQPVASNSCPQSNTTLDKLPMDQGIQETQVKLASQESEVNNLRRLLQERTEEVSSLHSHISEKDKTIHELRRMIVRSGQKNEGLHDSHIIDRFFTLKNDIVRFCKTALPAGISFPSSKDASPDINELLMRSTVGREIHQAFFHGTTQLFGHLDTLQYSAKPNGMSPYQEIEKKFLGCPGSDVTEDEIKEWRITTVNLARRISRKPNAYPELQADNIWMRVRKYSAHFRSGRQNIPSLPDGWVELCKTAYDLGLLFRSSHIDYQWQQDINPTDIQLGDAEVIGTTGVLYPGNGHRVGCVVFGGVVRGHRSTGKFRDGSIALLKPNVVIDFEKKDDRRLK